MNTERIESLVIDLSTDTFNPEKNFALAVEYSNIKQTAAALSFFLRAAEYGHDTHPLLVYASLLKVSLCLSEQGQRDATVVNSIHEAIGYLPGRPEAYFLLSRWYERNNDWRKCYAFAEVGLNFSASTYNLPLPTYVEYEGPYCLIFEKAVSSWWLGRKEECKTLFKYLLDNYEMAPGYVNSSLNNLKLFNK
ncbi:hypothetical protein UFOVP1033_5 [uncultured Caudovirales phage]|uniref:Uncharacterized protein n=1 Tax=uncultured Caudovirales phage TaxID=2100421 RepID=A0A6J5SYI6_9CAUD|nr:hypothetical protein UFOVP1033_5 [uncultured Caudovirales phage]CAB4220350.1 hypothetical protein UFOVP1631_5 [uncultured Caudovirales phage]